MGCTAPQVLEAAALHGGWRHDETLAGAPANAAPQEAGPGSTIDLLEACRESVALGRGIAVKLQERRLQPRRLSRAAPGWNCTAHTRSSGP